MLDRIEADRTKSQGLADSALDVIELEGLEKAQHLDVLALARLAHARFQQTPQGGEALGQVPAGKRRGLVERADLVFDQRQIVQRVEDQIFTLVRPSMPRDHLGAAADHDLMDKGLDQDLAVAIGHGHGIITPTVANQRQRTDPARALVAGVVRRRWQRQKNLTIPFQARANRLGVTPQAGRLTLTASVVESGIERLEAREARYRYHEVAPGKADQALDPSP